MPAKRVAVIMLHAVGAHTTRPALNKLTFAKGLPFPAIAGGALVSAPLSAGEVLGEGSTCVGSAPSFVDVVLVDIVVGAGLVVVPLVVLVPRVVEGG